jgi:peptide deformylase
MSLEIIKYGHPVLREKSTPIESIDSEIKGFARDMLEAMYAADGIGLAAQQVGSTRAMFVIDIPSPGEDDDDGEEESVVSMPLVFINPEITERIGEEEAEREGCLSLPEVYVDVVRQPEVTVRYQDLDGQTRELHADGLLARCIQHEYDHLQGVLMIDHVSQLKRLSIKGRLKRLKKETLEQLEGQA